MRPYERVLAWKHCHRLALLAYRITQNFLKSELYGITSQMRRAATSAAANIVEGCAKRGAREYARFVDIAVGSLAELSYFALLARDLGFLPAEQYAEFERLHGEAGRTTMGLCRSLRLPSSRPTV